MAETKGHCKRWSYKHYTENQRYGNTENQARGVTSCENDNLMIEDTIVFVIVSDTLYYYSISIHHIIHTFQLGLMEDNRSVIWTKK